MNAIAAFVPATLPPPRPALHSPQLLRRCQVRVSTESGVEHEYLTLAASTLEAAQQAVELFGPCKVTVESLGQPGDVFGTDEELA